MFYLFYVELQNWIRRDDDEDIDKIGFENRSRKPRAAAWQMILVIEIHHNRIKQERSGW